jgi:two-component system, sensor histidine kinase
VTPLIVLWCGHHSGRPAGRPSGEAALLYILVGAVGCFTFFHPVVASYPLAFLCLAPLVWGALRFEPREIATAVALLSTIAIAATATGHGSFVLPSANESLLVLQAFMGLVAVTALPMAARTLERATLLERECAARAQAVSALQSKDEFIAILSHELRNPLSAISAAAAVLADERESGIELQRYAHIVARQTRHLARLIDDLFDVGRMTANRMSLHKEPLDLAVVAGDCIRELEAAGTVSTGRIGLALEPAWVDADRDRMRQIINNLLANSIRHTSPDGRIRVAVYVREKEAVLRVEDNGAGIVPELLPHVFEPFRQGKQGLDRNPGGLGIGLTLVQRLAALHGGSVEAHSGGAGLGSAFVVHLPLAAPPTATSPAAVAEARGASERPYRHRRLLIVEDNEDARQGLRGLLESRGHEVYEAADGEAGVAAALELMPDVALVDIGLPLVDGYEVARRIKAANPDICLVALTGYGHNEDRQRARDAGFDSHLLKPVSIEHLSLVVEEALGKRDRSLQPVERAG